MPDRPKLASAEIIDQCPDCKVLIGEQHTADCLVAVCVTTGHQRALHADLPDLPVPAGLPADLDIHTCGFDIWTGRIPGVVEAVAHGLWARPATADESALTEGWVPCGPDEPGAVPDLDRLARTGQWNPIRKRWELTEEEPGRG